MFRTINPVTGAVLQEYPLLNKQRAWQKIEAGHSAFNLWRRTSFSARKALMLALANQLKAKKEEFALLIAQEMGKPILAGQAEIEKSAWVCEYFAEQAEGFLKPQRLPIEKKTTVYCQPLGIIFAIMPWNFPFWQVFRAAAPTLMAGNAFILKHAPITLGVGEAIAALFQEAGFPAGLLQHFIVDNDLAADIIAHPTIVGLTLTGSEKTGQIVAANAGAHLKKVVMELGGNDPYLVLPDANLDLAAEAIVTSRLNNCGQVCIAAKRIIVVGGIHDALVAKIKTAMQAYQMGDPLQPQTLLGPMAREDLRETLHQQVLKSIEGGAKCLLGGAIPPGKGFYYPPTLLLRVEPGMPAFDDELFGPVIAVIKARDEAHGIELANKSRYGLGAAVFTQNLTHGEHIAAYEIEAGSCFVNMMVASDPRAPFGGVKCSGFGRELSQAGILEFVNLKTVSVQ